MIHFDLLIAVLMLTTPGLSADSPPVPLPYFQTAAISLELMDQEDRSRWFVADNEWAFDMDSMRTAGVNLRDAPPLCDAIRWPSHEFIGEQLLANRRYGEWLQARLLIDQSDWIYDAIGETEELAAVWREASLARWEHASIRSRRQALSDLRDLIGPHAYYSGCLPPAIPTWRLWRVD